MDYGQICGFKITRHPDRFEAVRGEEVISIPWAGGRSFPALEVLVETILDKEYGKQRIRSGVQGSESERRDQEDVGPEVERS